METSHLAVNVSEVVQTAVKRIAYLNPSNVDNGGANQLPY